MAEVLRFGGSGTGYGVGLVLGIAVMVLAVFARHLHRLPEIRLSGLDIGGSTDLEEVVLPKEAVYLNPASATSMDCRDEPLIVLRLSMVVGSGVAALALFGLISERWLSASGLMGFVVSLVVGIAVGVIAYTWSARWFFGRPSNVLACTDVLGAPAEVTVPIPQDSFGQVAATIHGKRMTFSARASDQSAISRGAAVRVVNWSGGRVVVAHLQDAPSEGAAVAD